MKRDFWKAFARNRGAVVGLVILAAVVLCAIFADIIYPTSPWEMTAFPFQPPRSPAMPCSVRTRWAVTLPPVSSTGPGSRC